MNGEPTFVSDTVLKEFKNLKEGDVFLILKEHYNIETKTEISKLILRDSRQNFVTRPELMRRIVRKHFGQPEIIDVTFYPEHEIDNEIDRRIDIMIGNRQSVNGSLKKKNAFRRKILKAAFFSKYINGKNLEKEIMKRAESTGLTKEEVKRRLFCSYFKIGVKS